MKLSIITVNKDNDEALEKTINSVRKHMGRDIEYIIIDGLSNDTSVQLIKENTDIVSYWVSEPDAGIYSAMNKGIRRAQGEFCLFLNSGDCINPDNNIEYILDMAQENIGVYYSDVIIVDDKKTFIRRFPTIIDVNYFVSGTLNHQNTLIRRLLFEKVGLYDERLRICADWKFFLDAMCNYNVQFQYCPIPFCKYSSSGISSEGRYEQLKIHEMDTGISEVLGEIAPSLIELRHYRNSVYGNILSLFGESVYLSLYLKIYRYFARRLSFLRSKDNQ